MKKKILFIINPISGGKDKSFLPNLIARYLNHDLFDYELVHTQTMGHATALARQAAVAHFFAAIACGGDGTMSEVAQGLLNQQASCLGFIPLGSGNGLARHLKIPMQAKDAILLLNKCHSICIDAAKMNDSYFFNVAGLGFDAYISQQFAKGNRRGLLGYLQSIVKAFSTFRSEKYSLQIDGKTVQQTAFMLSLAGGSQFGNNAYIAPFADLQDGLLDVVLVKPFPWHQFAGLLWHLLRKSADQSPYVCLLKGKEISIQRAEAGFVHLDGEPRFMPKSLEIKVLPKALSVLVSKA